MKLLIVESPAKCKTIKSYLGPEYEVLASYGHIRDLAHDKHFFGIDIKNGFKPSFETLKNKYKYVTPLKNAVKNCDTVYLASDDDREGEAIAWHLCQVLGLDHKTNPRIVFREITKKAIISALENPRVIDMNMVYSQQSRQIEDKILGFELSPLLWKHISNGMNLSAGRVQSVVTRLIIDREKEIDAFDSKSFFKITGKFQHPELGFQFDAELSKNMDTEKESNDLLKVCLTAMFKIDEIQVKEENRNPKPPFITSTLQQEANSRLGLSTTQTMSIAQKLYEKGKITYMRTDSTNISNDFLGQVKKFVTTQYGEQYLRLKQYTKKVKGGQEAHECIRPTVASDITGGNDCNPLEKKLYRIIWQRTIASQMSPQKVELTKLNIGIYHKSEKHKEHFKSSFEKELFPGYTVIYKLSHSGGDGVEESDAVGEGNAVEDGGVAEDCGVEEDSGNSLGNAVENKKFYDETLSKVKVNDEVKYLEITATQKYTEPPGRFTEASLVKELEKRGIGRPSTYANMVSKIQEKQYVIKDTIPSKTLSVTILQIGGKATTAGVATTVRKTEGTWKTRAERNKLVPTDVGKIVTSFLVEHFDNIMEYSFTSDMEEKLDTIAQGTVVWNDVIKEFYDSFHPKVLLLQDAKTSGILGTIQDEGGQGGKPLIKAKDKFRRLLGVNPKNGENVYVTLARFGPCLQMGDDVKKADFISLGKDSSMDKITLNQALKLLEYPKNLGDWNGSDVLVKRGPYGFYIQWNNKNVGLPEGNKPENVTLEMAKKIVQDKETESGALGKFQDGSETIQILKGKWGPYIKKGTKNIPLKGTTEEEIKNLSLHDVKKIIEDYIVSGSSQRGRGRGRGGRGARGGGRGRGKANIDESTKETQTKKIAPVIKKKLG